MIAAEQFMQPALARGFDFWTGVPCSYLTPFINYVLADARLNYVGATSEGEAIGLAAGAALAGRKAVAICQNSGLGNMVNPLTSLAYTFQLPLLLIVTHRGEPGRPDEPQHELMGHITKDLLDLMKIHWADFPEEDAAINRTLELAERTMAETALPFALIMRQGAVSPFALPEQAAPVIPHHDSVTGRFQVPAGERMTRLQALQVVTDSVGADSAVIATTGMTGRELFSLGHRNSHLYMVGSMGCASSVGLGFRLASDIRSRVTVLDGDGAALMKLGTLATIGNQQPKGFLHVLLDNETHDSTGGQSTVSPTVDFASVALACGYHSAARIDTPQDLGAAIQATAPDAGPVLLHVKVARGSTPKIGRPTLSPLEVKARFMQWHASAHK